MRDLVCAEYFLVLLSLWKVLTLAFLEAHEVGVAPILLVSSVVLVLHLAQHELYLRCHIEESFIATCFLNLIAESL